MNVTWYLVRGSGFAAFGLATASMVWGLMVATKVFGRAVNAKGLQWLHESLGLAAVAAVVVHVVALSFDTFIGFTWLDLLVPGASEWRPIPTALGVVALWGLLLVSLSFYVRKWIGQSSWRAVHALSYGVFASALLHGVLSGTDSGNAFVVAIYVGSGAAVVLMTAIRVIAARQPGPSTGTRVSERRDVAPVAPRGAS